MSSTGTSTHSSIVFAAGGCTTVTSACAAEEPGDLGDRPHGGRQSNALGRSFQQRVKALETEGEMGTPLGGRDCVHLVDDHCLHATQRLAR